MIKKCLGCKKELVALPGKRINPKRKFCDHNCASRFNAKKNYEEQKDNLEYKARARNKFNKWYYVEGNRERQNKNVLKHYYLNKDKWAERKFCADQRDRIKQFINPVCASCKKEPTKLFFHKNYGDVPIMKGSKKERLWIIKMYTQRNLVGVCSNLCLKKEERRLRENEAIKN